MYIRSIRSLHSSGHYTVPVSISLGQTKDLKMFEQVAHGPYRLIITAKKLAPNKILNHLLYQSRKW